MLFEFPWQKWKRLAHTDDLTGVYNRRFLFSGNLKTRIFRYIHFVDVDNLGEVNRREGFLGGDALLVAVTNRLIEAAGQDFVICRIGGDEFVVFSNHSIEAEGTTIVTRNIMDRLTNDYIKFLVQECSKECTTRKMYGVQV